MKTIKCIIVAAMMAIALPSFAQFTTGGKTERASSFSENVIPTGYKGLVELGYGIGTGDFGADRILLTTSHGYQVNSYFFAGIGAGVNYYTDADLVSIPIFADFRGTLPITNSKIAPFLDMKIGYTVNDVEGFYFAPGIGIRIATSRKAGFNVGIGYELQKFDAYYSKETCGAFAIKVGYDF